MTEQLLYLPVLLVVAAGIVAMVLRQGRTVTIIYPPMTGLLYRDGRFARALPPGRHAWFDPGKRTKVTQVSLADLPVTLPEITVLSSDQFSYRLALSPLATVVDARLFVESQPAAGTYPSGQAMVAPGTHPALYPSLAAAALAAAGSRTLAETMAAPAELTAAVQARVETAVPGVSIGKVLLTAINLPPETRKMFTDVERSRMEARGALERARGEQAALRVLANAARLVEDNPALANLRLLQAIETTRGSTTIILGEPAIAPQGFSARSSRPAGP